MSKRTNDKTMPAHNSSSDSPAAPQLESIGISDRSHSAWFTEKNPVPPIIADIDYDSENIQVKIMNNDSHVEKGSVFVWAE